MRAEGERPPLILTALCDEAASARFEALRRAHFPPERNIVPAHLTLFHHLPGAEIEAIEEVLVDRAWRLDAMSARTLPPRFTGGGVAIDVAAPGLALLRHDLAALWDGWLIPQDRQPFNPHVTVQNRVRPEVARKTQAALAATDPPGPIVIEGLALWEYLGGPWRAAGMFPFGGAPS